MPGSRTEKTQSCLQLSIVLQSLLARWGIASRIFGGSMCCIHSNAAGTAFGWGGFWDKDHHVWLVTEFGELVDYSIRYCHLHPGRSRDDYLAIPPLWFKSPLPTIFWYVPEGVLGGTELPAEEQSQLDALPAEAGRIANILLDTLEATDLGTNNILFGIHSLDEFWKRRDPWTLAANRLVPLLGRPPDWMLNRAKELGLIPTTAAL
ncbi:MAG: hypothetical protein QM783_05615 [Phycisphaerales bacterium]